MKSFFAKKKSKNYPKIEHSSIDLFMIYSFFDEYDQAKLLKVLLPTTVPFEQIKRKYYQLIIKILEAIGKRSN